MKSEKQADASESEAASGEKIDPEALCQYLHSFSMGYLKAMFQQKKGQFFLNLLDLLPIFLRQSTD
jgi:hypothetical protein